MGAIRIPRLQAMTMLRPMSSGRTMPCLMLCQDEHGEEYEVVVKWRGGRELSERGLICELIASLLAADLDLPIPKPFVVDVAADFVVGEGRTELASLAKKSAGLNFASQRLPSGVSTWPQDKPVQVLLRPLASEIFAFDVLIQNPDRRRGNPNLLWAGDEIYLCDHEQAFSFLAGVIGWQPPWTGHGMEFLQEHVFFQQLAGIAHSWDRLNGALEALTDGRLREYIEAVPDEWRSKNDAVGRITDYLRQARENRMALFQKISHLLR